MKWKIQFSTDCKWRILQDKVTFVKENFPMPYAQAYAGWQFGQLPDS